MEKGLVSVIIPVYNAEKYIQKCWEYISKQSYTKWEVIFINDGSKDKTETICKELCETNESVFYYKKENGGPASARNIGIRHANGEYIYFMDVDDILHENAFELLEQTCCLQAVDLVIGNALRIDIYGNKKKEWANKSQLFANRSEVKKLVESYAKDIKSNKIMWSAWGKLYRASIIKENNILFNEQVFAWEDVLFVFSYLGYCDSCYVLEDCLYTYIHYEQANFASKRSYLGPMDFKYTVNEISKILKGGVQTNDNSYEKVINNCYSEYAIWSMFNNIRLYPVHSIDDFLGLYRNIHNLVNDIVLQRSIDEYEQKHEDNAQIIPCLVKHKMSIGIIIVFRLQLWNNKRRGIKK